MTALVLMLLLQAGPSWPAGTLAFIRAAPMEFTEPLSDNRTATLPCEHEVEDHRVIHAMFVDAFKVAGPALADVWSQKYCEDHNPLCREGNPLGVSSDARVALKGATAVAFMGVLYFEETHGHATRAKWEGWTYVVVHAGLFAWNLKHSRAR